MKAIHTFTAASGREFMFVNESKRNKSGFYHQSDLYISRFHHVSVRIQYYNRTWEPYQFYSVMQRAIDTLITNDLSSFIKRFMKNYGYKRMTSNRQKMANMIYNSHPEVIDYDEIRKKI